MNYVLIIPGYISNLFSSLINIVLMLCIVALLLIFALKVTPLKIFHIVISVRQTTKPLIFTAKTYYIILLMMYNLIDKKIIAFYKCLEGKEKKEKN